MSKWLLTYIIGSLWICTMAGGSCAGGSQVAETQHSLPDTLKVGTLYSPTSFFIYRGDTLGYDYERICDFATDKKVVLQFHVAQNMQSLLQLIEKRQVDILAYEIPVTAEFNEKVLHCGETNTTYQVLVQPKGKRLLNNVTQLVGKDIYVEKDSKYESRLHNLNSEIGGGINIHAIESDTLNIEDLVEQVSNGKIPLTIVDSDVAKINKTYYHNIDISLDVSFPQRSSWAVHSNDDWLADSIDAWSTSQRTLLYSEDLSNRYFEQDKRAKSQRGNYDNTKYQKHEGDISAFDSLFKSYATMSPYDWTLLAAIAKTESDFNPNDVSWAGARGLMQIMPGTARGYGIDPNSLYDPETSVKAAVKELNVLDSYFRKYVPNKEERMKFVLASYNAGRAHIVDAIKLAEKYDKNPQEWYGNVEECLKWKTSEKYYNDPVCRYGYFRSTETLNYVRMVTERHQRYKYR